MTESGRQFCVVHGEVDERVTLGGRAGGWTCPVMVRHTVDEFDEYLPCGQPLAATQPQAKRAS